MSRWPQSAVAVRATRICHCREQRSKCAREQRRGRQRPQLRGGGHRRAVDVGEEAGANAYGPSLGHGEQSDCPLPKEPNLSLRVGIFRLKLDADGTNKRKRKPPTIALGHILGAT